MHAESGRKIGPREFSSQLGKLTADQVEGGSRSPALVKTMNSAQRESSKRDFSPLGQRLGVRLDLKAINKVSNELEAMSE